VISDSKEGTNSNTVFDALLLVDTTKSIPGVEFKKLIGDVANCDTCLSQDNKNAMELNGAIECFIVSFLKTIISVLAYNTRLLPVLSKWRMVFDRFC
jgi:hypothetical protein